MIELLAIIGALIAGLFLGAIGALVTFFVVRLCKEGIENFSQFGFAAVVLLSFFGTGLFYLGKLAIENNALTVGFLISFLSMGRSLVRKEE